MDAKGYASRELFTQFLTRIARELPTATVAMFSTLKYVNAPNFEAFREHWNARYLNGFVVHSRAFDGLNGNFPIGFLVWQTDNGESAKRTPITRIATQVLDKNANPIGEKAFHNIPASELMGEWLVRPKPNAVDALPLKSAITPTTSSKDVRGRKWPTAPSVAWCAAVRTCSTRTSPLGCNRPAIAALAVFSSPRRISGKSPPPSPRAWPSRKPGSMTATSSSRRANRCRTSSATDCLLWMLFHNQNLTASADGIEWNGRDWSLVNHFIPYAEDEVGSPDAFESDFIRRVLAARELSPEARAVLDAGRAVWSAYFCEKDARSVREQFRLNRADVGWYQIRNALKARDTLDASGMPALVAAHGALGDKLRPPIFDYDMLLT
jgi:hypothetical protein